MRLKCSFHIIFRRSSFIVVRCCASSIGFPCYSKHTITRMSFSSAKLSRTRSSRFNNIGSKSGDAADLQHIVVISNDHYASSSTDVVPHNMNSRQQRQRTPPQRHPSSSIQKQQQQQFCCSNILFYYCLTLFGMLTIAAYGMLVLSWTSLYTSSMLDHLSTTSVTSEMLSLDSVYTSVFVGYDHKSYYDNDDDEISDVGITRSDDDDNNENGMQQQEHALQRQTKQQVDGKHSPFLKRMGEQQLKRALKNPKFDTYQDKVNYIVNGLMNGSLTLIEFIVKKETGLVAIDTTNPLRKIDITTPTTTTNTTVYDAAVENAYKGIVGVFCNIDWTLQQSNAAQVPMFKDLMKHSANCQSTMIKIDNFYDIAITLRKSDVLLNDIVTKTTTKLSPSSFFNTLFSGNDDRAAGVFEAPSTSVDPGMIVFHETRCGSTLTANTLAQFGRVYSEIPVLVTALTVCYNSKEKQKQNALLGNTNKPLKCTGNIHRQLIQDVFFVLGRLPTTTSEDVNNDQQQPQVFYKTMSKEIHFFQEFYDAMPGTPWMYVYRDSVEVIMSHFRNDHLPPKPWLQEKQVVPNAAHKAEELKKKAEKETGHVCLPGYQSGKRPHPSLVELLHGLESTNSDGGVAIAESVGDLSNHEYCATFLGSLGNKALQLHEMQQQQNEEDNKPIPNNWMINYSSLQQTMVDSVLPSLMGRPLTDTETDLAKSAGEQYSKSRAVKKPTQDTIENTVATNENDKSSGGLRPVLQWKDDSSMKQDKAPESIKLAAKTYLDPVYYKLELIRAQQKQQSNVDRNTDFAFFS